MKNITKRIVSMMLTVSLLLCATVPIFADDFEDEEYLSDLRIVYADDYDEATEILDDSGLEGYRLLDANLNENTGKRGVFLVYKTTDDVEDAITDIAVMQMDGGYKEGNYQEMIAESYQEYLDMGENYLEAIDYFKKAYEADNYLAKLAYRQLNFYNVVTEGIEEEPYFEGERIGDIFLEGIEASDLATMFMEGNSYALSNIRSLIAMGTSYNEDGKTYLEKVADEAGKYTADRSVYKNQDYRDTAALISPTITTFRDMLKELEAHADDLNYDDDEITELELKYMEYKLISEMLKATDYLDGKSLYDFCIEYTVDNNDYSDLYPLVAALNAGQLAMTKVAHYYDVVRYSMTLAEDEEIEAELAKLDEEYGEYPFNIYTGVDRTIYRGTFALTSDAYRADAYTESGLMSALYNGKLSSLNVAATVVGGVGACIFGAGLARYGYLKIGAKKASDALSTAKVTALENFKSTGTYYGQVGFEGATWRPDDAINAFYRKLVDSGETLDSGFADMTFAKKYECIEKFFATPSANENMYSMEFDAFKEQFTKNYGSDIATAQPKAEAATAALNNGMGVVYGLYVVGGLMMLASAITLGVSVINYYNPDYADIPTAMVDLINTKDGDRYIKYDVVYEAEEKDGALVAADLNAFEANRWNAMYYTKSYEAGKPLLADEFVISNNNNVPEEGYAPVHRFGEVVSYNLNKYNFNDDHTIYLSVKQSDNQKKAVADVPELVGSIFSTGYIILAGGLGIAAGAGGTIGLQEIVKRRKTAKTANTKTTE